jgi:hypothetical protein
MFHIFKSLINMKSGISPDFAAGNLVQTKKFSHYSIAPFFPVSPFPSWRLFRVVIYTQGKSLTKSKGLPAVPCGPLADIIN